MGVNMLPCVTVAQEAITTALFLCRRSAEQKWLDHDAELAQKCQQSHLYGASRRNCRCFWTSTTSSHVKKSTVTGMGILVTVVALDIRNRFWLILLSQSPGMSKFKLP